MLETVFLHLLTHKYLVSVHIIILHNTSKNALYKIFITKVVQSASSGMLLQMGLSQGKYTIVNIISYKGRSAGIMTGCLLLT